MSDSAPGVAVIGAGAWGRNHIRNFASRGCLRAVVDRDADALARVAAVHPDVTTATTLGAILDDPGIQAVVVASSSSTHFDVARASLEAGKHVLVEKPLAQSTSQAETLVRLAASAGAILMVGHLLEYHPAVDLLRRLVDAGELGELFYIYCQRVNLGQIRQDENALWSLGPHDVSIVLDLLQQEPARVTAIGHAYLQPGIEDVVFVSLTFPDGKIANIQLSWLDPHKIRRITLVGSAKMAVFDDMEATEKVRIYDKGVDAAAGGVGTVVDYPNALTLRFGDIHIPRVRMQEPLGIECGEFLRAIASGEPPRSDGHDGVRVVRVLEAAQRSLEAGGAPVALEAQALETGE